MPSPKQIRDIVINLMAKKGADVSGTAKKALTGKEHGGPGPTPNYFGEDPIDVYGLNREGISEAGTELPMGRTPFWKEGSPYEGPKPLSSAERQKIESKYKESGELKSLEDLQASEKRLERAGLRQLEEFDPGGPKAFGEEDLGIKATREAIQEASGPRNLVRRQPTKRYGSIEQPGAKEQLEDLFGEETTREADRIRRILNEEGVPTDVDVAGLEVAKSAKASEVDQTAKKVFDHIAELEDSLRELPASATQAERNQLRESRKLLLNFKREAAQTAEKSRKTNNLEPLDALLDRLIAPAKPSTSRADEAAKIQRLRELRMNPRRNYQGQE